MSFSKGSLVIGLIFGLAIGSAIGVYFPMRNIANLKILIEELEQSTARIQDLEEGFNEFELEVLFYQSKGFEIYYQLYGNFTVLRKPEIILNIDTPDLCVGNNTITRVSKIKLREEVIRWRLEIEPLIYGEEKPYPVKPELVKPKIFVLLDNEIICTFLLEPLGSIPKSARVLWWSPRTESK